MLLYLFFILAYNLNWYKNIRIQQNEKVEISQNDSTLVIFGESPLEVKIGSLMSNRTEKIKAKQYVQVNVNNLTIQGDNKESQKIHLWKIPNSLCNMRSMVFTSDFFSSFSAASKTLSHDFCLFSQFDAVAIYTQLIFSSSHNHCTLNFYSSSDINLSNPSYICHQNENCKYNGFSPFFIKLDQCFDSSFNITLKNQIARDNIETHECSITQITPISERGTYTIKNPLDDIEELKCSDSKSQFYKLLGPILVIFVVFVFIILCAWYHSAKNQNHVYS